MFAQAEHNNTIMKKNTTYLTILFLLLILSSCNDDDDTLPPTALCTKDATTMEDNYIELKGFRRGEHEYDHRVISFTNKQMKDNIEYLTAKAREEGVEEDKLGFRVYIAAKSADEFLGPNEIDKIKGDTKSYTGEGDIYYTTVFFVATKKGDSDDPNYYENVYTIPALDYGSSRIPPIQYKSNKPCPIHPDKTH